MDVLKADHHRHMQLAGVPDPVPRPVDIDQARTGFSVLRSLRIYRFASGSVIDGHAEEDEVVIVVLSGSVHLLLSEREVEEGSPEFVLGAVDASYGLPCAAYLPPGGGYRLTPQTDADIAYARATSAIRRPPAVFSAEMQPKAAGATALLTEAEYPQNLRVRVMQARAAQERLDVLPVDTPECRYETLVHLRTDPAQGGTTLSAEGAEPRALHSWDTVAVRPGEAPRLCLAAGSTALLLVVQAGA